MTHAINITKDGILKIRIPEGFRIDKVQVEEIGTDKVQLFCENEEETCDLIDRQEAIDSMANAIWHYPNELYCRLNGYENAKALAEQGLGYLPSASPDLSEFLDKLYKLAYERGKTERRTDG